jgi:hypothetical protein
MSAVSPASSIGASIASQRQIATEAALIGAGTSAAGGGDTPAVIVDLSEAAKAMMEQAHEGQLIADMLGAIVSPNGSSPA